MARRRRGKRAYIDEPIRTIIVNRREFEIHVDSDGEFRAHVAGDYIKADTLKAVIAEIRKKARKLDVKIAVPVTVVGHSRWSGVRYSRNHIGDVHHGTIVEYDSDNSAYRIKFEDGGTESLEKWGQGDFQLCKPLTAEQIAEWKKLRKERDAANERFNKFAQRLAFDDVQKAVKAAYEAAIDDPKEAEDEANDALEGDPRVAATANRRSRTGR